MIIEVIETEIVTTDVIVEEAVPEINVMITSLLEMIDEDHRKSPDEIQGVLIDEIVIDVNYKR